MAYATKTDITEKYGDEIAEMIVDHYREATETAEDALNAAIAAGQAQETIDALTAAHETAQADEQTKADVTITKNLEQAASIIDGYTKARYPYDWTTPPSLLTSINIDLAVHSLALAGDWRTDEMEKRSKLALDMLEMIRDGKISLTDGVTEDEPPTSVVGSGKFGTWARR